MTIIRNLTTWFGSMVFPHHMRYKFTRALSDHHIKVFEMAKLILMLFAIVAVGTFWVRFIK